jgi:hypothetical protein
MKRLKTAWEKRQRLEGVCAEITGPSPEKWADDEDAPPEVRLRLLFNRRDEAARQGRGSSGEDIVLLDRLLDEIGGIEGIIRSLVPKRGRRQKRKP